MIPRYKSIHNDPEHVQKGVRSLSIDGSKVSGNLIPIIPDQDEVTVEVIMGQA